MRTLIITVFAAAALLISACSDSDTTNTPTQNGNLELKTYTELHADTNSTKTPAYFSLSQNKMIDAADSQTTKWDLAFYATSIYVNSGVRGPGHGGVVIQRNTTMDEITIAPETGYVTEDAYSPSAITGGSGNGWYNYVGPPTHAIVPIPGTVLIIRTADQKYAKVRILNYYKGVPAQIDTSNIPRYYTFEYKYQPDGTRNLK
ncbi:MAG: hypothetical protein QG635_38 [Bacteroidota bacterium]|nr:hypothetical protein [Bacteroidota bacterium]